jgi:hypothetical protein
MHSLVVYPKYTCNSITPTHDIVGHMMRPNMCSPLRHPHLYSAIDMPAPQDTRCFWEINSLKQLHTPFHHPRSHIHCRLASSRALLQALVLSKLERTTLILLKMRRTENTEENSA